MKSYTVYKITNKLNKMIYVGAHITENINDSYMGSGSNIKNAIKKFGKDNFEKVTLHNFDNKEDMLEKEKEIVNASFIERNDTYNIILGGGSIYTEGKVNVFDKYGFTSCVSVNDPRYLSGELVSTSVGFLTVKDEHGSYHRVSVNDHRYLSGELFVHTTGMVSVKDKNNNKFIVSCDDIRYLSGELVGVTKGMKMPPITNATKAKISNANKGIKNSQYGTCWIYNETQHVNKKIHKRDIDIWINNGWVKGRKIFNK